MTADEIRTKIADLRATRDSGVQRMRYAGHEVEYRSSTDIDAAIASLEDELRIVEAGVTVRRRRNVFRLRGRAGYS